MAELQLKTRKVSPKTCALEDDENDVSHLMKVTGLCPSGQVNVFSIGKAEPQRYAATTALW